MNKKVGYLQKKNMQKYLFLLFIPFTLFSQTNYNLGLIGSYEWNNTEGSDIWGWADQLGNEYALVGLQDGFSCVNVTNPASPVEEFYISDLNANKKYLISR